ncbi:hypothetical protein RM549_00695 [Salegentibacter sp. F188]|uniref:YhhN-like protein n=1 Tax=Autumnicola patrickiae TaxID=3075591 RepID=A0ABU3DX64_9FLAO|nr:hypothetical protein [Salegentibacter sp. F188]MDT0688285.1 hypothetical protein [Salegentibacter sp. F188]
MKIKKLCLPLACIVLALNIYAILFQLEWLQEATRILFFIIPLLLFSQSLCFSNRNLIGFLFVFFLSELTIFLPHNWYFNILRLLLLVTAYLFLSREALRFTKKVKANSFILFFGGFLLLINGYFFTLHFLKIKEHPGSMAELSIYALYYFSLLILAIVALVYYINSYSKKSVFFIALVLAIIFADIFENMQQMYLMDLGIKLVQNILHFATALFIFYFFTTKEKKLNLRQFL